MNPPFIAMSQVRPLPNQELTLPLQTKDAWAGSCDEIGWLELVVAARCLIASSDCCSIQGAPPKKKRGPIEGSAVLKGLRCDNWDRIPKGGLAIRMAI